jgi:hypothetical protein
VVLRIAPVEATYVCVDRGPGQAPIYQGSLTSPRTFRGKRLRINLGRSSASLYLNGKRVHFAETADVVSFSFSRTGHVTPLPPGQRPCT